MARIRLDYVHEFRDRHGKIRRYFRKRGSKRVTLPGQPGSAEFMVAYQAALSDEAPRPPVETKRRAPPGTVTAELPHYYSSSAFAGLAAETQRTKKSILDRFERQNGDKRVAKLEQQHLQEMMATKVKTPAAARNFIKAMRGFLDWCVSTNLRKDNPAIGVKRFKMKSGGYRSWEDERIEQYRAHHQIGSRARVALELLLNIGPRRSDVVRLGHQHLRGGEFSFRTQKTKTLVEGIPLLPELAEALAALPKKSLTFLETEYGKPFTAAGFGNWFRDMSNEAGIPVGYSAHGLRKASATRLAESGATEHQLMAWFGWTTLREPERYTKAANNRKLARSAGALIKTGTGSGKPS